MKRFAVLCTMGTLLLTGLLPASSQAQTKMGDATAGYSLTLPSGWKIKPTPGKSYQLAVTAPVNGFAPNLMVLHNDFPDTVEEYVRINMANLLKNKRTMTLVSKSDIKTTSGNVGKKLVLLLKRKQKPLRMVYYVFQDSDIRVFTFILAAPPQQGDKYEKVLEPAIRAVHLP